MPTSLDAPLHLDQFIDGEFRRSTSAARFEIRSPASGELIGTAPDGTAQDIATAAAAAKRAVRSGVWSGLDPLERGHILRRVAEALADRLDLFATLDASVTGRPIREMRAQLSRLPEWFHHFAGIARGLEGSVPPFKGDYLNYTQISPLGVVGLITSWNHPLLIMIKKLSVALAAGNAVIVKPSELAPLSPLLFAGVATEAGLPRGVLNVVSGGGATVGRALCEAPEIAKLDLTGGTETGKVVARLAAERLIPATMELGGKAPVILFEDTPLEEAAAGATFASFIASGQTCVSGARILVHAPIYEAFLERFVERANRLRLGHPLSDDSQMGPLISERQMQRALGYIESARKEGGRIVAGGRPASLPAPLDKGYFLEPTIIADARPDMTVVREEIFGPVVCVMPFADEAEALKLANDHQFGLGASVWTRDIGRAHRVARDLNAGIVWINDHHKNDPASIWGGFGMSGYGKENGWHALRAYGKEQNVVVRLAPGFGDWYGDGSRYG